MKDVIEQSNMTVENHEKDEQINLLNVENKEIKDMITKILKGECRSQSRSHNTTSTTNRVGVRDPHAHSGHRRANT